MGLAWMKTVGASLREVEGRESLEDALCIARAAFNVT